MLRTNSVESKKVWSGMSRSLAALYAHVFLHPSLILLNDAVVLSQRVALPLFGQQNPRHVGMTRELDAEHIEDLALQPVGGQVDVHRGLRFVAIFAASGDVGFHAHPFVTRVAIQN